MTPSEPVARPRPGLLLSDDLLFSSRITGAAGTHGLRVVAARSAAALLALAAEEPPATVLVDLQNPGLDLADLLAGLRAVCPTMPRIVAYGSHVDAATLRAARELGCDPVLPRSRFVTELPDAISHWLTPTA